MSWHRRDLVLAGKLNPPMGCCISCGSDLAPKLLTRGRFCVYVCSRSGCKYEKRGMPRWSRPYYPPKP